MIYLIIYIIGILVYLSLPFCAQLILLVINSFIPDPVPFIDEIIMYASVIKKIISFGSIFEWAEEHPIIAIICGAILLIMIIVLLVILI